MFEQMVKNMYVPPDILEQLTDEQRDVLHYEIRQEQIRRYNEWQKNSDNSPATPRSRKKLKLHSKKKKEKHVTFVEGPDGKLVVEKLYIESKPPSPQPPIPLPTINGTISIIRATDDPVDVKRAPKTLGPYSHEEDPRYRPHNMEVRLEPARSKLSNNIVILSPQNVRHLQNTPINSNSNSNNTSSSTRSPNYDSVMNQNMPGRMVHVGSREEIRTVTHMTEPYTNTISIQLSPAEDKPHHRGIQNFPPIEEHIVRERNVRIEPKVAPSLPLVGITSVQDQQRIHQTKSSLPNVDSTTNLKITSVNPIQIRRTSTAELVVSAREPEQVPSDNQKKLNGDTRIIQTVTEHDAISDSGSDTATPAIRPKGFTRLQLIQTRETPERLKFTLPLTDQLNFEPSGPTELSTGSPLTKDTEHLRTPSPLPLLRSRPIFFSSENLTRTDTTLNGLHRRASPVLGRHNQQESNFNGLSGSGRMKISDEIRRRQQQLFQSSNTTVRKTDDLLGWFTKIEAPRLMQEFGLPKADFDLNDSASNFLGVPKWFHGRMSLFTAENLLRRDGLNGAFLVRVSSTFPGYVLSWFWNDACQHHLVSVICPDENEEQKTHFTRSQPSYQLYLQTNSRSFDSLRALVHFYSNNSLPGSYPQYLLHAIGQQPNKTGLPDYVELFYPDAVKKPSANR